MSEPIFVVTGVPRSGTSLMMAMLAAAGIEPYTDGLRQPDASNPRGYFEHEAVKRTATDATWTVSAQGRAVKVVHALVPHLPREHRYRVVLMRRAIAEVLASQRAMLERLGEPACAEDDARLGALFERQLADTEDCLRREPCFDWMAVDFGELIRSPLGQARRVAKHFELGERTASMAAVVEPALYRTRSTGSGVRGADRAHR